MTQGSTRPSLVSAIVRTGLIAGALDATAATTQYMLNGGTSPLVVWKYVASGAFGPDARTGGLHYAAAGLLMHFCIAMAWTALFYFLAMRVKLLRTGNPILVGVGYGAFVWVLMNRVVVPLSRIGPPKTFNLKNAIIGAIILMVCIGLPNALRARRDLAET